MPQDIVPSHGPDQGALWERLEREGRLNPDDAHCDNTKLGTNFVPKGMSHAAMVGAYRNLYDRLLGDSAIAERVRAKLSYMAQPLYRGNYTLRESGGIVWRLLARGIVPGGPRRIAHFLRSLPFSAPRRIPQVILDWIAALAMRDYVRRHFDASTRRDAATADRRFFARAARPMERILRRTSATLTLRIEAFREHERKHLERLLRRLARHGDRVSIVLSEGLRGLVHVDSPKFHLVLE
jgi:Domain of unknown function (DUF4070)